MMESTLLRGVALGRVRTEEEKELSWCSSIYRVYTVDIRSSSLFCMPRRRLLRQLSSFPTSLSQMRETLAFLFGGFARVERLLVVETLATNGASCCGTVTKSASCVCGNQLDPTQEQCPSNAREEKQYDEENQNETRC